MNKTKITAEEMAKGLSMFCKKFTKHFYEDFGVSAQTTLGIKLDEAQSVTLAREIWIINLWIISKVLSPDKKVLDELHKIYLFSYEKMASTLQGKENFPKSAEKELHERYKKYYDAWDDKSGGNQSILTMTMLEYMFNSVQLDKRLWNTRLVFEVNTHVLGMMRAVLDFRKDAEIIDQ